MKMINKETNDNDVKGAVSPSDSPSSVRNPTGEQRGPDRISATAGPRKRRKRRKWTTEENKETMLCYYQSKPHESKYRKRMFQIWQARNDQIEISEQNLADRANLIRNSTTYLTKLQLAEIKNLAIGIEEQDTFEDNDDENQQNKTEEREPAPNLNPVPEIEVTSPQIPEDVNKETFQKLKQNYENLKKQDVIIPNLKQIVSRNRFLKIVQEVNKMIVFIPTKDITETMMLTKAVILTVADEIGLELTNKPRKKQKKNSIPPWKQRMKTKLLQKRMDLSRLSEFKRNKLKNNQVMDFLNRKYRLHQVPIDENIEILKQEITALKCKIERYTTRCEFYRQNKLFETNQKRFYNQLDSKQDVPTETPKKKKVMEFWTKIWGKTKPHNENAEWISSLEEINNRIEKQGNLVITKTMVKKAAKKMKNWRAAGPDGIQGFWIKNLTSLHERLANQLQCMMDGSIPVWMTTGKTTLILKDPSQPTKESNYRPITCLPTIWKLLTSIISDEIYTFLENQNLIPWQQKGNKRKSYGTKDQLLIDKLITKTVRKKRGKLRMAWIDYRKAYDSVPHSWIIKCLKMYGIADNIVAFLEKSMASWRTELQLNQETVGKIWIMCGIFQGDSLSPLLFVIALIPLTQILEQNKFGFKIGKHLINHLLYMDDLKLYAKNDKEIDALVNTVRIFSEDINMQFGLDKCAKVNINNGKLEEGDALQLCQNMEIKNLNFEESYKYLGLLESDQIKSNETKEKVKVEYKKRLRAILKSKLHGRNQITAINTYALPVITYLAGIIKFTAEEKRKLDTMTRKQLTMHGSLHPRADVDRLYVSRRNGGRGLLSIEDSIAKEENAIAFYIKCTEEPILKCTQSVMLNQDPKPKKEFSNQISEKRKTAWSNKAIHGVWPKNIDSHSNKTTQWMQKSNLKPATESLITAAQDQALNTNWHKANILKTTTDELCRRCKLHKETIAHIISGCPELAQTVYLHRHNTITSYLHWKICDLYGLPKAEMWYEHDPPKIVENENVKVLYDFNIYTDKKIKHRRPDIVLHKKEERQTALIDVACPMDHNVNIKEKEKIENYDELKYEIGRLWKTKTKVIPIIIGALGTVSSKLENYLNEINLGDVKIHQLQKCVVLKTGNILQKHLQI